MTAQAKRSSAAIRDGSAPRGRVLGSRDDATRASSFSVTGSIAPSHRSSRLAIGLLVAALALLTVTPNATAFLTRAKTASFGSDGTAGTSFGEPDQLAFDQTKDRLYALDKGSTSIHAFNAPSYTLVGGVFPLPVASTGYDPDIAVDNTLGASASNIYYVAAGEQKIFGFDSEGAALGGNFPINPSSPKDLCGSAVDSAGNIWIGDYSTKTIRKYDSLGNPLGSVSTAAQGNPCHVAFDSNDDMFVALYPDETWKYTSASGYSSATKIDPGTTRALTVDTVKQQLYLVHSTKVSVHTTAGSFLYEFGSNIGGAFFRGVAVDQATDEIYVADRDNDKVHVFAPAQNFADATVTPTSVTEVADTSASLSGKVTDNNEFPSTWRLEVSGDGGSSWQTVSSGQTAGGQTGAVVTGTATGLIPNTGYKFRVVANKGPGTAEVTSSSLSFKTNAVPPVVSDVGAIHVTDTSARLAGTIDPRHSDTGYVFQYGTTPALGSSTPPVSIGDGATPQAVSQPVDGLTPDTTYYFKLVATNLVGAAASTTATFTTRTDPPPLPDQRGWEMVTPPDKNLGGVTQRAAVSLDGQAAGFCTASLFGEPPGRNSFFCAPYVSRRTSSGWQTTNPFPPFCRLGAETAFAKGFEAFLSLNFDVAAFEQPESASCSFPPLDPAAPLVPGETTNVLYRADFTTDPYDLDLLSPQPETKFRLVAGGSEDFSHLVYLSTANQTAPPDSPPPGTFHKLYEWHDGSLRLVSKNPSDEPFTTPSNIPAGWINGGEVGRSNAISRDGERIYFQNPTGSAINLGNCVFPNCELYLREGGATTLHVSASECTASCGTNQTDRFEWATPAGDRVFFFSCARLTDASAPASSCGNVNSTPTTGSKLYRWDRNAPPGTRLVDVTIDHEPSGSGGVQPNFFGMIGASADGDTAYFVARGQIVSGGPALGFGEVAIYRWRWNAGSPSVDYLATLPNTNFTDEHNWTLLHRRVTPDGRYLLISTPHRLLPHADADADKDVYRWDEENGWLCVSCQLPGAPSAGGSSDNTTGIGGGIDLGHGLANHLSTDEPMITMSDDGRVFFETPDALLPEDVNGESGCPFDEQLAFALVRTCWDVYEWDDGTLSLLSGGAGAHPSQLIASSASGDDVFFLTRNRLVGWDTDNGVDIYDARSGGGFPEPPPAPPPCEGEACRGAASGPPSAAGAGTAVFEGPGNASDAPRKRCPKGKRKVRRGGKVRCVNRGAKRKRHRRTRRHSRAANDDRRAAR